MAGIGGSKSQSQNTASQDVWAQQAPFLQGLFQQGAQLAGQFQPNQQIPGQAQQAWGNQLNPQQNPYLQDMTQTFRDNLGQMNQQAGGQAALTGGYGGGRQGVQNYLNQANQSQQMGQFLGGQYQQGQDRQQGAINQAPMMLGMTDQNQQWGNLGNLAQIIGGPALTSQSQGTSSSKAANASIGGG